MTVYYVVNAAQSGPGSIEEAIASASSSDVINFQVPRIFVSSEIFISRTLEFLTFNADTDAGIVILDGQNLTRILQIEQATVAFNNIRFINARSPSDGGAIHLLAYSTLILNGCEFIDNVSETVAGAIFARQKCTITGENCSFVNNYCISGLSDVLDSVGLPSAGRAAGAVTMLTSSNQTWKNSIFLNNRGWSGGAINSLLSSLTIEDCLFKTNNSLTGDLNLSSSSAFGAGGAIYAYGASDKNLDDFGSIILRRSRFEGNQGAENGGAASLYGYRPNTSSDPSRGDLIIVEDCLFLNNRCFALNNESKPSLGGALRIGGNTPEAIVSRCSFIQNESESQGGAISINNQPDIVKLHDCTIAENVAHTYSKIGGGMISESFVEIRHCTIAHNRANQGSAIQLTNSGSCDIRNSILYNNSRLDDGLFIRQIRPDLGFVGSNNIQFPDGGWKLYPDVNSQDPRLEPLTNEGDVYYFPLSNNSPAINVGDPAYSSSLDILEQERRTTIDLGSVSRLPSLAVRGFIMQDDLAYTGLYFS